MRAPIGILALILSIALAACASESSSGNAPAAAAPAPPPVASASPAPTGSVAAPGVSVAPPAPARPSGDVIVPGPARPINPTSDPRTEAQRMSDIRAWDRCVMQAQSVGDSNPTRPEMSSPEDVCRQSLGMSDRLSVPQMREQRR
jgi:hypothetical protein